MIIDPHAHISPESFIEDVRKKRFGRAVTIEKGKPWLKEFGGTLGAMCLASRMKAWWSRSRGALPAYLIMTIRVGLFVKTYLREIPMVSALCGTASR